jgi:hypothetical protein
MAMTINELGTKLAKIYANAQKGYKVTSIYLFGIKYANVIIENRYSPKDIILAARLKDSYSTELSKALKLSKFVTLDEKAFDDIINK